MIKQVSFLRSPASTTLFEILLFLRIISCFTASIIYLIFCFLSNSQLIKGSTIYSVFHFSASPSLFFLHLYFTMMSEENTLSGVVQEKKKKKKKGTASRNS